MAQRVPALALCLAVLLSAGGLAVAADGRGSGRQAGEGHGRSRPALVIEPSIELSRPRKPDRDAPEIMMANIEACAAEGVHLFVACLRGRASPVAIRRLEACLRSDSIPEDLGQVAACLPPAGLD